MAVRNNGVHPIFYALLLDKQGSTYRKKFAVIKVIKVLVAHVEPSQIHCDFDQAVFSTMKDCFPNLSINSRFYHMAQSMRKHIYVQWVY